MRQAYSSEPMSGRLAVVIELSSSTKHKKDCDNLAKMVLDSGNGIIWGDDSQIDLLLVTRVFGEVGSVGVEVFAI